MNKTLVVAALLAVAETAFAAEPGIKYPYSFKYAGNPLVRHISATDPDVHVWDGVVWMYCSQDHPRQDGDKGNYDHMDGYHVFSSSDLVTWTDHGEILHSRDIKWALGGWLWAPGAVRKDGKYYLYFPVKDKQGDFVIGVAVGDTPAGPFKDIGRPIEGTSGIDPAVFIDDDGETYLYCGKAKVAKLKPDLLELAEPMRDIDYAPAEVKDDRNRQFLEGAFMHKRGGVYYYSYTNFRNPTVQGFYATGHSPYGPFEWKGPMAPHPGKGAQYHHSIIEFNGQSYDFYHGGGLDLKPEGYKGDRRLASFDKLFYNEDGTIRMVVFTPEKKP